mmetsp:Transcript_19937/g.39144  ORF Transcript_19937/g.39144 Transcript_19937/m.39144 type:complete len:357 (+) Transcript_19937:122-1192(+)
MTKKECQSCSLELNYALDSLEVLEVVRDVTLFKDKREGSIVSTNTLNRSLEIQKALIRNSGSNFSSKSRGLGSLMTHNESASLLDRVNNCGNIPRYNGSEVNKLTRYTHFGLGHFTSFSKNMHLGTPANDGHIGTRLDNFCLTKGDGIVTYGDVSNRATVQGLGFEEQAWVRVADTGQQKTLGLNRITRNNYLKTGRMGKISFRTLTVVVATMADCTIWSTDGETTTVELVARTVTHLGSFINKLVKGWKDVISELNFGDCGPPRGSVANTETCNTLLTERGIEDAVFAELVTQAHAAAEDTTKGHILTKENRLVVCLEGNAHSIVNGHEHVHALLRLSHVLHRAIRRSSSSCYRA